MPGGPMPGGPVGFPVQSTGGPWAVCPALALPDARRPRAIRTCRANIPSFLESSPDALPGA